MCRVSEFAHLGVNSGLALTGLIVGHVTAPVKSDIPAKKEWKYCVLSCSEG